MFPEQDHDFGSVARAAKAEHLFTFTNPYLEDVHVAGVRSSCGCTIVRVDKPLVKSRESSEIVATFNTRAFTGQRGATVTVTFDRPYYAEIQLHVKGYIRSDVVFVPASVQFDGVSQGTAIEKKVAVHYAGRNDWRILDVRSPNSHLSGKVSEVSRQGGSVVYELFVGLDANAPAGYIQDHLVLVTNDRNKTQVPICVEGIVQPEIMVSPASLFMGIVHPGETVTKQVVVRGKQPFRILGVDCDGSSFKFETASETAPKPLHMIPVTFAAGDRPGKVEAKIRIQTDLGNRARELPTYAVVSP
jgi:hypothetical protein